MKTAFKYKLQAVADNARNLSHQALKRPVSSILSLCVVAGIAATIASFSQTSEPTVAVTPTAQTMPVARTLTSADGRTIDVVITAKTATNVTAKKADGKEFEIALDKLSAADKAFVARLAEAPFKKMRVLMIGRFDQLAEKMKETEFDITVANEVEVLQKLTDQELEGFDAIVVTRNGCSANWRSDYGKTPSEKVKPKYIQRDRILKLVDQGKIVAWRSHYKTDKKNLVADKGATIKFTAKGEYEHQFPFVDVQQNTIFYSWTSEMQGRESTKNKKQDGEEIWHYEFLDQMVLELKKTIKK